MKGLNKGGTHYSLRTIFIILLLFSFVIVPFSEAKLSETPVEEQAQLINEALPADVEQLLEVSAQRTVRQVREEKIRVVLSRDDEENIRNDRVPRSRQPQERAIPNLPDILNNAQERKTGTQDLRKLAEKTKYELGEISRKDLEQVPPAVEKRITRRANLVFASLVSDISRFGNFLGLSNLNIPLINDISPQPLDADQCNALGCVLTISGQNFLPPFDETRDEPLTFALVSLEHPVNQWQQGWSENYHIISIRRPSPNQITFRLPLDLEAVNKLRITLVNYIDQNMYLSNPFVVKILGVPREPLLEGITYDANTDTIALHGYSFYPDQNQNTQNPYTIALIGDVTPAGRFSNGVRVDYTYQSSGLLHVDPEELGGDPDVNFLIINKWGNRFTVSEPLAYHHSGPSGELCTNGVDDDGDGLSDCNDPDCVTDPACVVEICTDGIDNDGDGFTDCSDPDCATHPNCQQPEICTNGVDDDGDGLSDCNDPDCTSHPSCTSMPGSIGVYGFDEGTGTTVADSSGNGNTGNIMGATWSTACRVGKCLNFDGTNDYVEIPDDSTLNPTNGLTLATWFLADSLPGSVLIGKGTNGKQYHLRIFQDKVRFSVNANHVLEVPFAFQINKWYHVAATFSGSMMKVYVNGNAVGSPLSVSATIDPTDGIGLNIGRRHAMNYVDGRIDEVYVFNHALSAMEIGQLVTSAGELCTNGVDDDGDGLSDCNDPDCVTDPACVVEICTDGIDNDGDGFTDCSDPDCFINPTCQVAGSLEVCDNGIDDDSDTLVDCTDILDCCGNSVCFGTPSCTAGAGDHVATVELGAPTIPQFTLHAVVPVAPGSITMAQLQNGQSPFSVKDAAGLTVPAQTEVVTRAANGDPDVVEVIARVNRGTATPSQRIQYKVIIASNVQPVSPGSGSVQQVLANGPVNAPQHIKNFVTQPLIVRAHDVFGHTYTANIFQQRYGTPKVLRFGKEAAQVRTYNTLTPITGTPQGPPNGALPHLLGIHAYIGVTQDPALQLDLRISNAAAGLHPASPDNAALNITYFKDVEILVPTGYAIDYLFDHPSMGTPYAEGQFMVYPIIKPEAGGKMNMMRERAQTSRRMVIGQPADFVSMQSVVNQEGLGFVIPGQSTTSGFGEIWSWNNPLTGNYFPQKIFLPRFDYIGLSNIRNSLLGNYQTLKNAYEHGLTTVPVEFNVGNLGPFSPFGVTYGGMTGGTDIDLTSGQSFVMSASREGYLSRLIEMVAYTDRHSVFFYKGDGEPLRYEDAVVSTSQGNAVPWRLFGDTNPDYSCPGVFPHGKCDPFNYRTAPQYQKNYAEQNNLAPSWKNAYLSYDDIDEQHLIRVTKNQLSAVYAANDALAKDDVFALGEIAHAVKSTLPMAFNPNPVYNSGSIIGTGSQGKGTTLGRGDWHPMQVFVGAYTMSRDNSWRNTQKSTWYDYFVMNVLKPSQIPCTGILGWSVSKATNHTARSARGNEMGMGDNVMRGIYESVYKNVDITVGTELQNVRRRHAYALLVDIADPSNPYSWSHSWTSPRTDIIVAPVGNGNNIYCTWSAIPPSLQAFALHGGPANYEPLYSMTYGKLLSADHLFDRGAYDILDGQSTAPTLLQRLEQNYNTPYEIEGSGNSGIFMLACAQRGATDPSFCHYP